VKEIDKPIQDQRIKTETMNESQREAMEMEKLWKWKT
jgi:hypothetical protein